MRRQKKKTSFKKTKKLRLNKFLADCGVASRRRSDELIQEGQIQVNGKVVHRLGVLVDLEKDRIIYNKQILKLERKMRYLAFYKPKKVLSTMNDPKDRPTLYDYVRDFPERLFCVGRLDWDSEGLIILTNDGDFSHKVAHPRHKVHKTYRVKVKGFLKKDHLEKLKRGVTLSGKKTKALIIKKIRGKGVSKNNWAEIVISEGKNQQIRRMFEKINLRVIKLKRVSVGSYHIGKLKPGEFRVLSERDRAKIFKPRRV